MILCIPEGVCLSPSDQRNLHTDGACGCVIAVTCLHF
jgi:hypothetical protein